MSQIDTGPVSRILRAPGANAPRQEIGSLTAPGLSVPPPFSPAAQQLEELLGTLRGVSAVAEGATEVANSAGYDQRVARSEAEAAARDAKAEEKQRIAEAKAEARANAAAEREAAHYDAGLGSVHASTDIGTLLDPISRGEAFSGSGNAEALADDYIAGQTKGQTQDYANAYARHLKPQLVAAITRRRGAVQAQARTANNDLLQRAALEVDSPAALMQLEATYLRNNKAAGATSLDAKSFLGVAALHNAAEAGDEKRMAVAASVLGPEFEPEKRTAEAELLTARRKITEQATIGFSNEVARQTNDLLTGKGGSFAAIEKYISSQRGKDVPETAINSALDSNRAAAASSQREAVARIKLATKQQLESEHVAKAAGMADADMLWNARPLLNPETGEQMMSVTETQQAALRVRLGQIAQTYPPGQALTAQVEYSARTGVPYNDWKDLFEAGRRGASVTSFVGERPNGQPAEIPPAAIAALNLYQTMKAAGPGLIPDMPAKAVELYETATVLQQSGEYAGDPVRAMLKAAEITSKPSLGDAPLRAVTENIRNATTGWFPWSSSAPANIGEVATDVQELAKVKVRAGMDPKKAVDESAREILKERVRIGDAMVPVSHIPGNMRDDLPKIAATLASNFLEKYKGLNLGLDANDVTLTRDRTNGFWKLTRASDGAPLNYPGVDVNDVYFDTGELEVARSIEMNDKVKDVLGQWQSRNTFRQSSSLFPFGVGLQ